MKTLLFLFIFASTNLFAQNSNQQIEKQMEEIMKARAEMFDALMNDSGDLEKRMLEMMRRLSKSGQGMGLGLDDFESPVVGEYDWLDSNTHRILKLKIKQIKDRPLDIKIEKGMVKIKGDLETSKAVNGQKSVSRTHFERTFAIPEDVDQTSPEFESSEGEILIKFKKISAAKSSSSKSQEKSKAPDRVPVSPDKDDLSI